MMPTKRRRPLGWQAEKGAENHGRGSTAERSPTNTSGKTCLLDDAERLRLRREALRDFDNGSPPQEVVRRTRARARSLALLKAARIAQYRSALAGTIVARQILPSRPLRRTRSHRSRGRRVAGCRIRAPDSGEDADSSARPRGRAGGVR